MGVEDDSFKKAGAVPFKWEIKPGVPKLHYQSRRTTNHRSPPPAPPEKLRPPPSGSIFQPPVEARTGGSFRSAPRTRSERWRFDDQPLMMMVRRQSVSAAGCFFSPLFRRKPSSKKGISRTRSVESEPDCLSDLETLSRWSLSSPKSFVSPFRDSPSSSSFSSYQSSPRPLNDAEWAGFGLF